MDNKIENKKLAKALFKKAMGYSVDETTEEFLVDENGKLFLQKKKVTTKHIPPDIPAARALLEYFFQSEKDDLSKMTDDELYAEKARLLKAIKQTDEQILKYSE